MVDRESAEVFYPEFTVATLPPLDEPVRIAAVELINRRDADPEPSMSRPGSMTFHGHGLSKELQLEASKQLVTFTDGGKKRVLKRSAYNRLIWLLIQSNPPDQPQPKIRAVETRFKKKAPRPRTEAELRGLAVGRSRAAEAARRRREDKARAASAANSENF
jgi:hypothetical protein